MKTKTKTISSVLLSLGLAFVLGSTITQLHGASPPTSQDVPQLPVITIHSIDNVTRGMTGSFVLEMRPVLLLGGTYVNFSVSGTAVSGLDYLPLVSPAYIGQSGYGTILVQTLPRGFTNQQSYSVVVTLEPGFGYTVGTPSSATMWIKP